MVLSSRAVSTSLLALSLALGLGACSEAEGDPAGPASITGRWLNAWGYEETISATAWNDGAIVAFDPEARVAVVQSPAWDPYTPGKFARHEWTAPTADGTFFYCTAAFGLPTAEAALAAPAADATDPGNGGCGGFSWTHLTPAIAVSGRWATDFAFDEVVSSTAWTGATVVSYDNAAHVAISQLPADDEYNPSKFQKTVWIGPTDGEVWFCTVAFGLDTADAAAAAPDTSDPADLDAGCGGFGWTHAVPGLAIGGDWTGADGDVTITSQAWGDAVIASYDNDLRSLVLAEGDDYRGVAWLLRGDTLWVCVGDSTAASSAAALAGLAANAATPEAGGCAGHAWTELSRQDAL
ncbi:MAG: hypothetical protein KC635_11445 [Myxococcales bacterium]|nr:hypothetical protein [Myxococcales bacterium]